MNYRIRYRRAEGTGEAEEVIEANSPNEALVKFRCTRRDRPEAAPQRDVITSVHMTDHMNPAHW